MPVSVPYQAPNMQFAFPNAAPVANGVTDEVLTELHNKQNRQMQLEAHRIALQEQFANNRALWADRLASAERRTGDVVEGRHEDTATRTDAMTNKFDRAELDKQLALYGIAPGSKPGTIGVPTMHGEFNVTARYDGVDPDTGQPIIIPTKTEKAQKTLQSEAETKAIPVRAAASATSADASAARVGGGVKGRYNAAQFTSKALGEEAAMAKDLDNGIYTGQTSDTVKKKVLGRIRNIAALHDASDTTQVGDDIAEQHARNIISKANDYLPPTDQLDPDSVLKEAAGQ